MYLKSLELKGFKSFPDRTLLRFDEGVSVVVGPNGSGKSNITDAVLWCLGEQSPLAVRGQSMQDVISAGGRGVQARREASVELVLDNSDGTIDLPASELSIVRRLDRSGEGEYRLNGARCRLIDVLEVLSDTGIGKEAHSVISQGRVEAIVTSKPRERRMLIEEAAGLGKHRKRRRRAQLKLERTQDNLDRGLDVEREARARLRPLKRQAEAAEAHARLERQTLEARSELARDTLRARTARLTEAEAAAADARSARASVEQALSAVAARREAAEQSLAARSAVREQLAQRVFAARSANERIALRLESATAVAETARERGAQRASELAAARAQVVANGPLSKDRMGELEQELAQLDEAREARLASELVELEHKRTQAGAEVERRAAEQRARAAQCAQAERAADAARSARREAERAVEAAARESARVGAELAAVNQFLRSAAAAAGDGSLEHALQVQPGYELALAAALGELLEATVVADRAAADALLERSGAEGGRALVGPGATDHVDIGTPPCPGAERLRDVVRAGEPASELASRLLHAVWVVPSIAAIPARYAGVAVTRAGRLWHGALGELRQLPLGGRERALEQRNRRESLVAEASEAAAGEQSAGRELTQAEQAAAAADGACERGELGLREAGRALEQAIEGERRAGWLIAERRRAPEHGEIAIRRARLAGELAAERRAAERAEREAQVRELRIDVLAGQIERDEHLLPRAEALAAALSLAAEAVEQQVGLASAALAADTQAGAGVAEELSSCAAQEGHLQLQLRAHGEVVTSAEVQAQQARDAGAESRAELAELAERLGFVTQPAREELAEDDRRALRERIERLDRRREQLGPVNPLAAAEYSEALERVEELETQRSDLEAALRELRALIRETDKQISERFEATFSAAALNFQQLVEDVFPGGRGRLRLVREDAGPRPVLGGEAAEHGAAHDREAQDSEAQAEREAEVEQTSEDELLGVEIEITPAGKSMKRLTLLSGGEKSMTALAFMFAVFLARPCPFYILDEVEAALDDINIDRFLTLLRRHSARAQFIVVTHQKRTMEAADVLYGVSMGGDGVSKIVSRRLAATDEEPLAGVA